LITLQHTARDSENYQQSREEFAQDLKTEKATHQATLYTLVEEKRIRASEVKRFQQQITNLQKN